jgi:hypothetical protein
MIKKAIFTILGLGIALGAPLVPTELHWVESYEVSVIDTVSGQLEDGQYFLDELGTGYVYQIAGVQHTTPNLKDVQGLNEVHLTGQKKYFSLFEDDATKEKYTDETTALQYKDLDKLAPTQPTKTIFKTVLDGAVTNAAVVLGATTSPACVAATSLTYSHTQGTGSGLGLTVTAGFNSATGATTVSYAGVNITLEKTLTIATNDTSEIYKKETPATGANNVVVNVATSRNICSGAASWSGVDQTDMTSSNNSATNNSTTASVTCTTAGGEWLIDSLIIDSSKVETAGAGQVNQWNQEGASGLTFAGSTQDGSIDGVMSWTWAGAQAWGNVCVSLRADVDDTPYVDWED